MLNRALRTLILSCFLLMPTMAGAESELEKFKSALPKDVQEKVWLDFFQYELCAKVYTVAVSSFEDREAKVEKNCKEHLANLDRHLSEMKIPKDQRAKLIERYTSLTFTSRQITREVLNEERIEREQCDRKMDSARDAYVECIDGAWRALVPLSTDT